MIVSASFQGITSVRSNTISPNGFGVESLLWQLERQLTYHEADRPWQEQQDETRRQVEEQEQWRQEIDEGSVGETRSNVNQIASGESSIHSKCKTGGLHGKGCGLLFGGTHIGRETTPGSCQWCSRVKTHPEPTCYWCTTSIKEKRS